MTSDSKRAMQTTPTSERIHIAIFGRCNSGKSTLVNRLTGQEVSIVSAMAGTTTDPVQKPMELNGLGAAVIIDTPGLDDNTELGSARMARTAKMLDKTDIAIVLFTDEGTDAEMSIINECRVREIPTVVAVAQIDRIENYNNIIAEVETLTKGKVLAISAERGDGVILNTSSMVSITGQPSGVAYPTSKFAVNGLTLSLAREFGPKGIRVNAVVPGITETDMMKSVPKEVIEPMIARIPLRRLGQPEDIAKAVVALCDGTFGYATGQSFILDGGMHIRKL